MQRKPVEVKDGPIYWLFGDGVRELDFERCVCASGLVGFCLVQLNLLKPDTIHTFVPRTSEVDHLGKLVETIRTCSDLDFLLDETTVLN